MRWIQSGKKKDDTKAYKIPGGLTPGKQIILKGRVSNGTTWFPINFCENEEFGNGDTLFHFNPRPNDGVVVRNSHIDGSWGPEEREQPHFPFDNGKSFSVRIDVTAEKFIVYVNGKHFVDYAHRLDVQKGEFLILGEGAEYYDVIFLDKPVMPYITKIPNGMSVGKVFRIRGMCTSDVGFSVNFMDDGGKYYFHFNPRPQAGCVVRNANFGDWGGEERDGPGFPFSPFQYFDASFVCMEDKFSVFVNDEHFTDFNHRDDLTKISVLNLQGNLSIMDVDCSDTKGEESTKEVESGLEKGDVFEFQGMMKPDANRFDINFVNENGDIAFHFNPRRNEDEVVMNNCEDGAWQSEERTGLHPVFKTERPFEVKVETKKKKFKVFINGVKFCKFRMRCDVEAIRSIQIRGDVFILETLLMKRQDQPIWEGLPTGLQVGSWITVRGFPKKHWTRFQVNFMCSGDEDGDIAFHFNPRKDQGEVVRNSRLSEDGDWGPEETEAPEFPFEAKDTFEIVFHVGEDKFFTFLNGKNFIEYNHRTSIERICHLCISGDCNFFEPEIM
ncbi:uncharacterized protein LOC133175224 [Saccostrea echinata]|uniref:uncharacterized protein LOC133175224 n=1 Tax=Saccostrea echinata TaxID=191078 RepID=UPI002A828D0B|nr:uncharacterized protein LOC133175224 [Saccostrea echinata]